MNPITIIDQNLENDQVSMRHLCKKIGEEPEEVVEILFDYVDVKTRERLTVKEIKKLLTACNFFTLSQFSSFSNSLQYYLEKLNVTIGQLRKAQKRFHREDYKQIVLLEECLKLCEQEAKKIESIFLEQRQKAEYEYMSDLIFQVRNINYIESMIESKKLMTSQLAIIYEVIKQYIDAVLLQQTEDIIYYQRILELYDQVSSKQVKKEMRDQLKREFKKVPKNEDNLFLISLEQKLYAKEEKDFEEQVRQLNHKYQFYDDFSKEALEQLQYLVAEDVVDCTDKYTISMDDCKASVFEDAISLDVLENGNYLLGVYISDVAGVVPLKSPLGIEMLIRAKDLYLPDRIYYMAPYDVRTHVTLCEDKKNIVVGHFFEFTSSLELVHFEAKKACVTVDRNYTFADLEDINLLMVSEEELKKLRETLHFMNGLDLGKIEIDAYHKIKELMRESIGVPNEYSNTDASRLCSKLMVLTNYTIASSFDRAGLPFLYRNNMWTQNKQEFLTIFKKYKDNLYIQPLLKNLKDTYLPSTYSYLNEGHAGLRVDSYGHTTCPVRNYSAYLNQHLVEDLWIPNKVEDQLVYAYEEQVKLASQLLNQRNMEMVEFQKEFCKLYYKKRK